MSDSLRNTQVLLRNIQSGELNGIKPEDCHRPDAMAEICRVFERGGHGAALKAISDDPDLLALASMGDLEPGTPPFWENTTQVSKKLALASLSRNELGDAEMLAALYENRIVYDHAEKTWHVWIGHRWGEDKTKQIYNLVTNNVAGEYLRIASELQKEEVARGNGLDVQGQEAKKEQQIDALFKRAKSLRTKTRLKNVLDMATSLPSLALAGDEWETDPMVLGVKNGVIDLASGEFRAGRPADYIRTVAPVAWQQIDAPAPRWEQFLQEIFAADSELIDFVQRLLGYGITGKSTEHVFPIFWGQGRNGKGTILETLNVVLGDKSGPVAKDVLFEDHRNSGNATPHLYDLRAKRMAWVSEPKKGVRLNTEQVKWLTGGDTIIARQLHKNNVTFKPQHLLILLTNPKPQVDADDYAIWKRLLLIPFSQSFIENPKMANEHKADKHLPEKLRAELPGILAWLVRGCLAWQREGLNPPQSVRAATDAYQQEEDVYQQFIEECCVVNPEAEVQSSDLYKAYKWWTKEVGLGTLSSMRFSKEIAKWFGQHTDIEKRKSNGRIVYSGIGLSVEVKPLN